MFTAYIIWSLSNISSSLSKTFLQFASYDHRSTLPIPLSDESPPVILSSPCLSVTRQNLPLPLTSQQFSERVLGRNLYINKIFNSDTYALRWHESVEMNTGIIFIFSLIKYKTKPLATEWQNDSWSKPVNSEETAFQSHGWPQECKNSRNIQKSWGRGFFTWHEMESWQNSISRVIIRHGNDMLDIITLITRTSKDSKGNPVSSWTTTKRYFWFKLCLSWLFSSSSKFYGLQQLSSDLGKISGAS